VAGRGSSAAAGEPAASASPGAVRPGNQPRCCWSVFKQSMPITGMLHYNTSVVPFPDQCTTMTRHHRVPAVASSVFLPSICPSKYRHLHRRRCVRLCAAAAAQHGCIPAAVPHGRGAFRLCSCGCSGSHQRQQQHRSSAGAAAGAARPLAGQDGCHRLLPGPCCRQQPLPCGCPASHPPALHTTKRLTCAFSCMLSSCEAPPADGALTPSNRCFAGAPPARKLSAAALAAALTLPVPPIADRLDLVVAHITSVCYEV
jgi:hypothetical protein